MIDWGIGTLSITTAVAHGVLVVLLIAAIVKYLFFSKPRTPGARPGGAGGDPLERTGMDAKG